MPAPDTSLFPRYDIERTYRWNYDHAPKVLSVDVPIVDASTFAGLPTTGPLGIAAGPLLNGGWILYYASLGFDVFTYKTVRSRPRDCYSLPNLVHVPDLERADDDSDLIATTAPTASWAVSFGMPSSAPDVWREDIQRTRRELPAEKVLNVSVVGTVQPGWSIEELADDYAWCAQAAVESGADAIEANLSCPNVSTCDGQLYQRPDDAAVVAKAIRERIGDTPLVFKIGHMTDPFAAERLLESLSGSVTAIAMTNSVAGRVRTPQNEALFDGDRRGICGRATLNASLAQVRLFSRLIRDNGHDTKLIGVGGASTAEHVRDYLAAGAECVHLATAVMLDPAVALAIKADLVGPR